MKLLSLLLRLGRDLCPSPCPLCGSQERDLLLRRDRYWLPVNISTCRRCGFVHNANRLPAERLGPFYASLYPLVMGYIDGQHRERVCEARLAAAFRMARIREVTGDFTYAIDVGCGLGFFLDEIRALGSAGYGGIEPGDASRRHASDLLGFGDNVRASGFDGSGWPEKRPDLVTMFHVLEHLEDPISMLTRIRAGMAADGMLVVEVPDMLGDWSGIGLSFFNLSHIGYFTAETLEYALVRAGFQPVYVRRSATEGTYPANLTMFARPDPEGQGTTGSLPPSMDILRAHMARSLQPWSWRTGYPRWAIRLLKWSLTHKDVWRP